MSTKNTEETVVSTSATTEHKTSDNKKTFGPLGKYAVIAVIMVSIIVTTAIMLNKQLGSVEEELAVMKSEAAEIYAADPAETVTTDASEVAVSSSAIIETQNDAAEATETDAVPAEVKTAEIKAVEVQADKTPTADVLVAKESTAQETVAEAIVSPADTAATESVMEKNPAEVDQVQLAKAKRDQERQARIESFKLEQKQHMAEMFARIKTLEAKQLDDYKSYQDKQIERLRQQIARQEQLIEELIVRNKDRFDMRAASMQRSQSNRAGMLNRI